MWICNVGWIFLFSILRIVVGLYRILLNGIDCLRGCGGGGGDFVSICGCSGFVLFEWSVWFFWFILKRLFYW